MANTNSTKAGQRATAECLASIEAVEELATSVRRVGRRNKAALVHVLNDYIHLLHLRCKYQGDPALDVRLKRVVTRLAKVS